MEDNLLNQELAVALLEMMGISVDVADNGLLAVNKVKQNSYDAVLMDFTNANNGWLSGHNRNS